MRTLMKILAGTAGLAAFAAAPAAAQYVPYNPYGYSNPYGYASQYGYGYSGYAMNTSVAQQQCTAAVQSRLYNRTSLGSILGSMIGLPTANNARIVGITSVTPHRSSVTVRGLASSGRYAYNGYGPYGVGAYGSLGYAYQPDLSFKCTVDYRGYVRDIDINRR
jgi:hypothetical protein